MNPRITVAGVMLAVLAGCTPRENVKVLGSHRVKVKPGTVGVSSVQQPSSSGGGSYYAFNSGNTLVFIKNEELIVNQHTYGMLSPGDSIDVDHGSVFVNGKKRQGRLLTGSELLQSTPFPETTGEVGGYPVTVRPGAAYSTKSAEVGKHTITVGPTVITVEEGSLAVNGESYGKLAKGDTITVEQGRVIVSGKERSATK
jgi:hypothetical protein